MQMTRGKLQLFGGPADVKERHLLRCGNEDKAELKGLTSPLKHSVFSISDVNICSFSLF